MSARSPLVRALPCLACEKEKSSAEKEKPPREYKQPCPTTEHHLNLGGRAGQRRRGDDYSVPLCEWHHQGTPPVEVTASQAAFMYGPSLARTSKLFRATYGTDDQLLARTNELIHGPNGRDEHAN
jgi:hypothetical protein